MHPTKLVWIQSEIRRTVSLQHWGPLIRFTDYPGRPRAFADHVFPEPTYFLRSHIYPSRCTNDFMGYSLGRINRAPLACYKRCTSRYRCT